MMTSRHRLPLYAPLYQPYKSMVCPPKRNPFLAFEPSTGSCRYRPRRTAPRHIRSSTLSTRPRTVQVFRHAFLADLEDDHDSQTI
jgi:hypothetical protein